jgi:hypothetical protein
LTRSFIDSLNTTPPTCGIITANHAGAVLRTSTTSERMPHEGLRLRRPHRDRHRCGQAAGAQRVFDTEPEMAREALRSIETTGRGALIEMRRLLDVLQIESGEAEIAPQPGLDQLPFFIAEMGRAGLTVQLCLRGPVRRLPPVVELTPSESSRKR